jgi:hypothetical protein
MQETMLEERPIKPNKICIDDLPIGGKSNLMIDEYPAGKQLSYTYISRI